MNGAQWLVCVEAERMKLASHFRKPLKDAEGLAKLEALRAEFLNWSDTVLGYLLSEQMLTDEQVSRLEALQAQARRLQWRAPRNPKPIVYYGGAPGMRQSR